MKLMFLEKTALTMKLSKLYFWGSNFEKVFFGWSILTMYFFRDQFWKCIFWESNFKNILFDGIKGVLTDCAWERGWIKKMDAWDANKQYGLLKHPVSPGLVLRVSKSFVISFLRLETSISWNIRIYFSWWTFFIFSSLDVKVYQVAAYFTTFRIWRYHLSSRGYHIWKPWRCSKWLAT